MTNWLHRADNDIHHYTGASRLAATAAATPGPWPIFAPDPATHGDPRRAPARPLRPSERELILQWLKAIDETDPATIAHVLAQCDAKPGEREQILSFANAIQTPCKPPDERRTCRECANLSKRLVCLANERGDMVTRLAFLPVVDRLMRCEGYQPGPDDPDRRSGRARWFPANAKSMPRQD